MADMGKLTPVAVAKKKKRGRYADGGGLYLQISQWGTKSWTFRYMRDGRARVMGLGDIKTFTLKEARERARAQRQLLADKIDPLDVRKRQADAARLEAAQTITFKDAATRYIRAHRAGWKNEKHAAQWEATLTQYAYPVFGDLSVAAVNTTLVKEALEPIWYDKTETANRVRGRIEAVLSWATAGGYRVGENPARWRGHLDTQFPAKGKVKKVRHMRALPWTGVPAFMAELRAVDSISARALEFCVLTAARTSEVIGARLEEIDFENKLWIIPATRTKSKREHRVPLSDRTLQILKNIPCEHRSPFVFPGARKGRPLSNMAMLELLRDMGTPATTHGFRSSFRVWAAEATNFAGEIAEAALAHVLKDKTQAAYQRGDLLEKRRRLMLAWEGHCGRPSAGGSVVTLRPRKGSAA